MDARPSDAFDDDLEPVREMGWALWEMLSAKNQRVTSSGQNMSCCRVSSGFAHRQALFPTRVPQPPRPAKEAVSRPAGMAVR